MKHEAHVCDGGGVPAQWLVEGPRFLPRVASRAHGAVRAGGREAGGSDRRRCIIWDYDDRFKPSARVPARGLLQLQIGGHGTGKC